MKHLTFLAVTLTLAACGGGGGGTNSSSTSSATQPTQQPPVATATAPGLYLETNTVRLQKVNFLITNALVIGFAGNTDANGGMSNLDGVFAGTGVAASGNYSANLTYYSAKNANGTLNVSYANAGNLTGTLTVGGVSQPLTASYPGITRYDFNTAAAISEIAGKWQMNGSINVSIDSSGLLTGSYPGILGSCTFGGLVVPDTSTGKNVFLVSFSDANTLSCGSTAGNKVTGEAVTYLLPNGQRQLLIMGVTPDVSEARGMAGIR
jgi:hypothetical protein